MNFRKTRSRVHGGQVGAPPFQCKNKYVREAGGSQKDDRSKLKRVHKVVRPRGGWILPQRQGWKATKTKGRRREIEASKY